jgi:hypothetical protein
MEKNIGNIGRKKKKKRIVLIFEKVERTRKKYIYRITKKMYGTSQKNNMGMWINFEYEWKTRKRKGTNAEKIGRTRKRMGINVETTERRRNRKGKFLRIIKLSEW